jgi:hypothetical protein
MDRGRRAHPKTEIVVPTRREPVVNKNENLIDLFNLTNLPYPAQGMTFQGCGSLQTGIGILDITRCTIAHELGHTLFARAANGDGGHALQYNPLYSVNGVAVFGDDVACDGGGRRWSPGERGWSWREHPIQGTGDFAHNLCATTERSIVIREFEADMFMGYSLFLTSRIPMVMHDINGCAIKCQS